VLVPTSQSFRIVVRPLVESDLRDADRIFRLAFGTFVGLPDPARFGGDADYVHTRWKADPTAVFVADYKGEVIGSNFAANWGSFGFFGPLTVDPEYWNSGVAQKLLEPTMAKFREWGNCHLGLYTFAQSPKHMALYQKFGFWPRDLVAFMAKDMTTFPQSSRPHIFPWAAALYSGLDASGRERVLQECAELTDSVFPGLNVTGEIRAVAAQNLGDTVLLRDNSHLAAFAVCHVGAGSEAGSGVCYVKFAAVRAGSGAAGNFRRLLDALEKFAQIAGAEKLSAGVNLARRNAFREMFDRGFRTQMQGVAMETGDAFTGYNRAEVYVLDDWR
jgi:GNAT superfamily N-acetyltransferase